MIKMTNRQIQLLGEIPRLGAADAFQWKRLHLPQSHYCFSYSYAMHGKHQVSNLKVIPNQS